MSSISSKSMDVKNREDNNDTSLDEEAIFCSECGTKNSKYNRYCVECGHPLYDDFEDIPFFKAETESDNKHFETNDNNYSGLGNMGFLTVLIPVIMLVVLVIGILNINVRIIYHDVNGALNINPTTKKTSSSLVLNDLYKDGYYFEGWYIDEAYTKKVETIDFSLSNINLYAKWKVKTYSISYILDGGSFLYEPIYNYDISIGNYILPTPQKYGYVFLGWWSDLYGYVSELSPNTLADLYLYAIWEASAYEIHYYNLFDTNNLNNPTYVYYDNYYVLTDPGYRDGYVFVGWRLNSSDGPYVSEIYNLTSSINLIAEWDPIQYQIYYYDVHGNLIYNDSYTINDYFRAYEYNDPDYVINGWRDAYNSSIYYIQGNFNRDLYLYPNIVYDNHNY